MGKRLIDWIAGTILLAVIATLGTVSHVRNTFWKSEVGLWEDCVRKAPEKERTHHNLGYAYYESGRWEDARREFELALALNPRYTLSMYNLGLVFYQKGMMEKAIDHYQRALSLNLPPAETYFNLGLAYYRKGHYSDAVKSFQTLVRMRPSYLNAYNCLGLAYQRLRQWGQAVDSYQAEVRRNPDNPYSYLYLGDLYFERKNNSRALVYYKKALSYPDLAEADRVQKIVSSIERPRRHGNGRKGPTVTGKGLLLDPCEKRGIS